jgi:hypothetical protein
VVARGFAWGANPEVDYRDLGPDAAEFGRRVRMSRRDGVPAHAGDLSRLFLDNIYSIGASWVTMGPHVGQMGLAYGASDMGQRDDGGERRVSARARRTASTRPCSAA